MRLDGYPPEVSEALNGNAEWVQLNPGRTFVLQGIKEDWMRYAVPMVAAALTALSKKALIERFEVAQLNLGMRSFLHVTYGDDDPNGDLMPDVGMLNGVQALFKRAMTGGGIATTNPWAKAQFIQLDTKELFQYDKYRDVNAEILASGGVSGIIVSGRAEDGSTFASAQVSIQTVAMRIQQAKDNFCEMMNKVNRRLCEGKDAVIRVPAGTVPRFTFPPTDLSNSTKLQEACYKLWKDGVLSNSTMLKVHGYDMEQENALIRDESDKGIARPSIPQGGSAAGAGNQPGTSDKVGRPEMDDSDRSSDKSKAQSGKAPKPSNPEGSL